MMLPNEMAGIRELTYSDGVVAAYEHQWLNNRKQRYILFDSKLVMTVA